MHDWPRVPAAIFHDFRFGWIVELRSAINDLLPEDHYAIVERPEQEEIESESDESLIYARKADHLAIHHVSGDRVVAFVELVSPGNKHSAANVKRLIDKLTEAFERGCHLLLIDPHPPSKHDPAGLHAAFWPMPTPTVSEEEPLSVSAYRAGPRPTAYFEPLVVGKPIPSMPLFLTPDDYINVPLEATYQTTWRKMPERWKRVIEL